LIDKQLVKLHFNQHAHEYDRYALVQVQMVEQLLQMVNHSPKNPLEVQRILEIGCGTGRLTERLTRLFPNAYISVLDLCEEMLERTKIRCGTAVQRYILADGEQWPINRQERFDLIVSNATFQWFENGPQALARYAALLSEGGTLVFSTFLPGTFCELHESFAAAERDCRMAPQSHGLSYVSNEQWTQTLASLGDWSWHEQDYVHCYKDVLDFLHSVKRIGAGNVQPAPHRAPSLGKTLLQRMIDVYETRFQTKDGIQVTYQAGFARLTC
jgi:malonyl-CoA O-methyltransferase